MTIENRIKLNSLMLQFNAMNGNMEAFHSEWKPFIDSLSKADSRLATQTMLNTILQNAQEFRKVAVHLIENGTDENRQTISDMVKDFKGHPVFDRNRATI